MSVIASQRTKFPESACAISLIPSGRHFRRNVTGASFVSKDLAPLSQAFLRSSSSSSSFVLLFPLPAERPSFAHAARRLDVAAAPMTTETTSEGTYRDLSETLSLKNIRRSLILMEDTIIFGLIERAQFRRNDPTYRPGTIPVPMFNEKGEQFSLLNYLLRETEQIHGRIRRYTSPEETPFFPADLPPLMMPPITYPQILWPPAANVNINSKIMDMYLNHLLPAITEPGDDSNYGSAALHDVVILQALSRRIHYGKFVAEAKFRQYTEQYTRLIKARDADGILELLTDREVELRVIERVKLKASTFGRDLNSSDQGGGAAGVQEDFEKSKEELLKVSPEVVAELYDTWVMPLTKEVEVDYLLKRIDGM